MSLVGRSGEDTARTLRVRERAFDRLSPPADATFADEVLTSSKVSSSMTTYSQLRHLGQRYSIPGVNFAPTMEVCQGATHPAPRTQALGGRQCRLPYPVRLTSPLTYSPTDALS